MKRHSEAPDEIHLLDSEKMRENQGTGCRLRLHPNPSMSTKKCPGIAWDTQAFCTADKRLSGYLMSISLPEVVNTFCAVDGAAMNR
jgi:hypothetical protein